MWEWDDECLHPNHYGKPTDRDWEACLNFESAEKVRQQAEEYKNRPHKEYEVMDMNTAARYGAVLIYRDRKDWVSYEFGPAKYYTTVYAAHDAATAFVKELEENMQQNMLYNTEDDINSSSQL